MSDQMNETAPKLPQFLDIHAASSTSTDTLPNQEWGMFSDNEGRIIAQRVDLVFEESKHKVEENCAAVVEDSRNDNADNGSKKEPGLVLVVATDSGEELPPPSSEMPEEMFSSDLETSYCRTKTWVEKQEDISESILSHRNLEYDLPYNDDSLPTQSSFINLQKKDIIRPRCGSMDSNSRIKKEWYIRKPAEAAEIVDDITIIDTHVLANDLRKFLKHHLIPLSTFAKNYLNRTQGTLSDLLNHPKPWDQLSNKGKEVYVKLIKFLSAEDLPRHVSQLRKKQPNNSNGFDKLPFPILEKLTANIMPSDEDILAASANLHLSFEYIKKHCEAQLKCNRNEFKRRELNYEFYTRLNVCDAKFVGRQICLYFGCGLILPNKSSFDTHLKSHYWGYLHHCMMCHQGFATKSSLNTHLKSHTRLVEFCSKTKDELVPKLKRPIGSERSINTGENLDEMKYICGVCWSGFKSRQQLTKHLSLTHSIGERSLKNGFCCYVCAKVLKNISALDVHMRTHTNSRPYECNQCKMRFQTKANLQRHMRIHTGEKPYACKKCDARFTEAKSLAIHMRRHTGEKPFQCTICKKRFAQYSPLQSHMLIHQEKKPHLCEVCGKSFRQKANLQVHIKRHRGIKRHKCSKCEMAFLTKTDYDRHLLRHTGERPHQCPCCMKSFTRSTYLQDHLKKLKGPSTPKCEICLKKFCDDNSLKKHAKIHEQPDNENSTTIKKEIATVNHHNTERFTALGNSNENMLLLTTKASFNDEKHYIIAPVQSIDDGHNRESFEEVSGGNFQPLVLTSSDASRIPFSTSEHPVFLQGIDISGQQVSVVASNEMLFATDPSILTTVREISVPITLSDEEDARSIKRRDEVIEGSDPNMQCAIAKTSEDGIILTQGHSVVTTPEKHMKLSTPTDSCHILVSDSNSDENLMVTMEEEPHSTSTCNSGLSTNASERMFIGGGNKSTMNTQGQTYIIVDLEL